MTATGKELPMSLFDNPPALTILAPAIFFFGLGVVCLHAFLTRPDWFSGLATVVMTAAVWYCLRLAWKWAHEP